LIIGDLLDSKALEQLFDEYEFHAVMHFAAKAYVFESIQDPIKYYRENISGSVNLIEKFLEANCRNLVFSSSCATYGNPSLTSISENTFQSPINPYGFTKLAIEKLVLDVARIKKFNFAILRYFNAAGADPNNLNGEKHQPETHVIPLMIRASKTNREFEVYGNNHDTEDGTAVRDYVHVLDLATGHLNAMQYISQNNTNIICNLGTGSGISVKGLIKEMQRFYPNLSVSFSDKREGDPPYLVANNQLSKSLLKMSYENSDINNIIICSNA
jgi:UDP-glucose-4-epimerase GalE